MSYRANGTCTAGACDYTTVVRRSDCAASGQVCDPDGLRCVAPACSLTCAEPTPFLDSASCTCRACRTAGDCAEGESCSAAGACGVACFLDTCSAGVCVDGLCVDCAVSADCTAGSFCSGGTCQPCACGAGQTCTDTGACVDVSVDCTTDAECVARAAALGRTDVVARCDRATGCYVPGVCEASATDPATAEDPFLAACGGATTCSMVADFTTGAFFTACGGCTVGDDSTCRAGETCTASPFAGFFPDYCAAR